VEIPGPAIERLGGIAREHGVFLSIGVIERDRLTRGTLYCTQLYFGPDGVLLGKHRKLKPTGSERLIWGEGDGSTLSTVDTPFGRLGGLICWENYMPLARAAMYAKGVDIYLAPTADSRDTWQATLRHIGSEGRCFVLGCNQFVTRDMYPPEVLREEALPADAPHVMSRGGQRHHLPVRGGARRPPLGRGRRADGRPRPGDADAGAARLRSLRTLRPARHLPPGGGRARAARRDVPPSGNAPLALRHAYLRKRSVASTSACVVPGSYAACPASGMIFSSASGHALCSAQALSMGQQMS